MPMNQGTREGRGQKFVFLTAAFIIIIAGIRMASPILEPFLLSVFLAIVCGGPLTWLRRKGVPRMLSLMIVVVAITGMVFLLAALVGTSLNDFSLSLPVYQARLNEQMSAFQEWAGKFGIHLSDRGPLEAVDPGAAMKLVASLLKGLGGVLTNTFLILLLMMFVLFEATTIPAKVGATSADPTRTMETIVRFISSVQLYMGLKTAVSLATGIAIAVWLAVLGVDYPMLWGFLAFLLNYIPNIGSMLAAVPAVLLAILQLGSGTALLAALGYLGVNIFIGNVIEPRIMGKDLGLSTLVVFLSLVFWGWVLGPVGMFLSVPLTNVLKIGLESSEDTRWIAVFLGPKAPVDVVSQPPQATGDVS